MITSILFYIIGSFLAILSSLLGAISSFVPLNVQSSFTYVTGFFKYFSGIINWPQIIEAVNFYIAFLIAWFTFLFAMWIWSKMPFFGKKDK